MQLAEVGEVAYIDETGEEIYLRALERDRFQVYSADRLVIWRADRLVIWRYVRRWFRKEVDILLLYRQKAECFTDCDDFVFDKIDMWLHVVGGMIIEEKEKQENERLCVWGKWETINEKESK